MVPADEQVERPADDVREAERRRPERARGDGVGRLIRVGVVLLCAAAWAALAYLIF